LVERSPLIQAPIMAIGEAKKQAILNGVGQCATQMLGARIFNQREGNAIDASGRLCHHRR
jgi:hypothetical protein